MENDYLLKLLNESWKSTVLYVIKFENQFLGKKKEYHVASFLKKQLLSRNPHLEIIGPESPFRFSSWFIDLVVIESDFKIPIEIKFKLSSDGAVPDNRKAVLYG